LQISHMRKLFKILWLVWSMIMGTSLGCTMAIDAVRPGEELHVRLDPVPVPRLAATN